jgi:hypothetical protein
MKRSCSVGVGVCTFTFNNFFQRGVMIKHLKTWVSLFSKRARAPRWLSLVERLPRKQQAAGPKPARGSTPIFSKNSSSISIKPVQYWMITIMFPFLKDYAMER